MYNVREGHGVWTHRRVDLQGPGLLINTNLGKFLKDWGVRMSMENHK